MNSPELSSSIPVDGEIQENKRNGFGYWMYLPAPAAPPSEALPEVARYGDFTEMSDIIKALTESHAVLVNGAPGSGKSHLVRDIQTACVLNSIPAFCLTMHINSGKKEGVGNITPYLDDFRDKVRDTGGGLLILDNIDIVGYKGKRRPQGRTAEYAQAAEDLVKETLGDSSLFVVATAHDDEWREGRWTWNDAAIDEPAQAVLDAFPTRLTFEGSMILEGLANILWTRSAARAEGDPPITIGQAAQIMKKLQASKRANFFHANHLDVETFMRDPNAAIAEIEHGRAVRRGKA